MANANDFKLVNIKSKKMFSFIRNIKDKDIDDVEKSRLGFYHLVLENVTGVRDIDEVSSMIIDTDYNRIVYGKTFNDLGIDAINYIGEDDGQEVTIQLFNFKFRNKYKQDKNMEESSINGSIKFLEYICCDDKDKIMKLQDDIVRTNILIIYEYLNSNKICNLELIMVSNEDKTFTIEAEKYLGLLQEHFGIRIKPIALDDVIGFFNMERNSNPSKFMISPTEFLSFQANELSTQKSFVMKLSLIDIIRITCNDEQLRENYNLEDDMKMVTAKLDFSLLYDNVRGYLGDTNYNVNIQKTLKDNHKEFFMLNNGMTITAESIDSDEANSGKRFLFTIRDYQIVNGGQTIRSIYQYLENESITEEIIQKLSDTYILVRFFKISKGDQLKNRIAEYTNSQNSISSADLKSVDSIQIQIEQYFKEEKILYARKAGEVGDESIIYEYRISKEKLAQIIYSSLGYPDRASNQKKRLFQEYYEEIFGNKTFSLDKAVKLLKLYYDIDKKYIANQDGWKVYEQKNFYVIFIVEKYEKTITQAIEILETLIKEKSQNITESRLLLKNKFKEALIEKLGKQTLPCISEHSIQCSFSTDI